jgi:hypothetical protein
MAFENLKGFTSAHHSYVIDHNHLIPPGTGKPSPVGIPSYSQDCVFVTRKCIDTRT